MKLPASLLVIPVLGLSLTSSGCLLVAAKRAIDHRGSTSITIHHDSNVSSESLASNAVSDDRKIGDFKRLVAGSAMNITATIGPKTKLVIRAPKDVLDRIRTRVDGDTLTIDVEGEINIDGQIGVELQTPNLVAARISGASELNLTGLKEASFEVEGTGASQVNVEGTATRLKANFSGASHFAWTGLAAESVDISLVGASVANLTGKTNTIRWEATGASEINADELESKDTVITAMGASKARLNVKKSLKGEATGASEISYTGSPQETQVNSSGASSINSN